MDTRVIRQRGVLEDTYDRWKRQGKWVLVLLIVWAAAIVLGYRHFDKEFPPFATLSSGTVEIQVMTDKENPKRLKSLVTMATKIGWERYPADKPVAKCVLTPTAKAGYETSCELIFDKHVWVKQKPLADDEEVRAFLRDMRRDATTPVRPMTGKKRDA